MSEPTSCELCEEKFSTPEGDLEIVWYNDAAYCEECYHEVRNDEADAAWDHRYLDHEDDLIDGVGFADPGGRSALRAETASNPRNLPCPNCGTPNKLTPIDRARGYQCDSCADADERGF